MDPDLIIQIGTTLVSTEIQSLLSESMKRNIMSRHILLHPHGPDEQSDPGLTVTHKVSAA